MIVRLQNTKQASVLGPYILQLNPDTILDILYRDSTDKDGPVYKIHISCFHDIEYVIKFIDTVSRDIAFDDIWIGMTTPPLRENEFYKKEGEQTWH